MSDFFGCPSWRSPPIYVHCGPNHDPIEITLPFSINPHDPCRNLLLADATKIVRFPPEEFPPQWEDRDLIADAIITAALHDANAELIKAYTNPKPSKSGERSFALECKYGRRHYNKSLNNIVEGDTNGTTNSTQYKPGVRQDKLVNKDKASRGTRKAPKRGSTTKPTLEQRCIFRIKVVLKPGEYWCIKPSTTDRCCHNHMKLEKGEVARRTSTLSDEERENAAIVSTYANNQEGNARVYKNPIMGTHTDCKICQYHL